MESLKGVSVVLRVMSLAEWRVINKAVTAVRFGEMDAISARQVILSILRRRRLAHPFFLQHPLFLQAFQYPFFLEMTVLPRRKVPIAIPVQFAIPLKRPGIESFSMEDILGLYESVS